jgi:hypothetical protein
MTAPFKRMTHFGIVLGALLLLAWSGAAAAATLDQEACAGLKTELGQLELTGVRGNMAKGPEWAKGNLSADKLQQIKRLIELDEQILFRCQGKPLVVLPEGVDAEAAPAERKDGVVAKPAADGKAQAKEVRPPAGKAPVPAGKAPLKAAAPPAAKAAAGAGATKAPADKAGTAKAAAEPPTAPAKAKPKPAAKAKVDDAYKPAPAAPGTDPSGKQ